MNGQDVVEMRTRVLAENLSPARVYAYMGSISLLLLIIFVPPFQVPDEPQHFNRSY